MFPNFVSQIDALVPHWPNVSARSDNLSIVSSLPVQFRIFTLNATDENRVGVCNKNFSDKHNCGVQKQAQPLIYPEILRPHSGLCYKNSCIVVLSRERGVCSMSLISAAMMTSGEDQSYIFKSKETPLFGFICSNSISYLGFTLKEYELSPATPKLT